MYNVHYTLYLCKLYFRTPFYSVQYIVYIVTTLYTVYSVQCTMYYVQCTLYSIHVCIRRPHVRTYARTYARTHARTNRSGTLLSAHRFQYDRRRWQQMRAFGHAGDRSSRGCPVAPWRHGWPATSSTPPWWRNCTVPSWPARSTGDLLYVMLYINLNFAYP